MAIIGIDPGLTGAIAVLRRLDGALVDLLDMPTEEKQIGKGMQVDAKALHRAFSWADGSVAYLEHVQIPSKGHMARFSLGDSFGRVYAVLEARGIKVNVVWSQNWKRAFGLLGKGKDASRSTAKILYPEAELSLKKHHNRGDAICIARYGLKLSSH